MLMHCSSGLENKASDVKVIWQTISHYICISAVKRLISSKIKVFVYIIYVCTVYLLCIYEYTHMHV